MDISEKLQQVNARLKTERVRVSIEQVQDHLVLRATLPPKPGSDRDKPYRQRISLGLPANLAGLREAEKRAKLVGAQLAAKEFNWEQWGHQDRTETQTCKEVIARFQSHYLDEEGETETTWQGDYLKVYKKLPSEAVLTPDLLETLVRGTAANTRSRQRAATACTALAKFVGIEWNGNHLRGNYSPSKVEPRDLPDDEAIARYREQIINPAWRWVYGMMATYGLRNHEVFHLDLA